MLFKIDIYPYGELLSNSIDILPFDSDWCAVWSEGSMVYRLTIAFVQSSRPILVIFMQFTCILFIALHVCIFYRCSHLRSDVSVVTHCCKH